MDDVDIETPLTVSPGSPAIDYTPLRDIPEKGTKGKGKVVGLKRRKELSPEPQAPQADGIPTPSVKRRTDPTLNLGARKTDSGSGSGSGSGIGSGDYSESSLPSVNSRSTTQTSPSPPIDNAPPPSNP